jgi:alkanesulfonate monooxygenase SsuD/methylene tetrahydromethanopterin reductase-like flavin-dependent oxidoreductase (luciferase family)
MWEESLSMVPDIWRSDWYSYEGEYWQVPERQVLPKPFQDPHPPIWVASFQPSTYELAASKGIGVLSFGSSAPDLLTPHIENYRQNVKKANPVGGFINDQWASSTLGICLEDGQKARELGAQSLKNFFGPDRPYAQGQKDIYAQLLDKWGGVPDDLKQNFSRYTSKEDGATDDSVLDLSGGSALAHKVWEGLDADTLCDRAVVIAGNPDDCIEALKKHEASGVDQMMVMMQTETIPHEKVMESIRLWGEYIIPEFKKSSKEVSVS